jgi:6-pyruvoyl-tetrahydropterin synthase
MRRITITRKINLLVLFIIAFMLMPSIFFAQNSISVNSDTGKNKISIRNNRSNFEVKYEGEITLSDDDKDIQDISSGGYIEIKKSSFGRSRKIVIEKEGNTLIRKFYIGWSEKEYDPEGKNWLADILPEILRSTKVGAKSRVNRFYNKGGVNEVLSEIKKMDSDYVQSVYFKLLLKKELTTKETIKTLEIVSNTIKSDYYLSNVLRKNQQLFLKSSETLDAYITAAKNVNSDYYLNQIVKATISNRNITDTQLARLLNISSDINSDYYLSDILKEVMDNRELNKQNMLLVMKLSKSINSDHYKSNILKKALRSKNLSKGAYDSFLISLKDINSDHYITEVIKEWLNNKLDEDSLNQVLESIKTNISSDNYATIIYKKIASRNDLTENQLINVLNATEKIGSSNYLSSTLLAFAPQVKKSSNKVKDVYIKVAKSISSETYFGRAMKAIY